jgi:CBS domain-containing protein
MPLIAAYPTLTQQRLATPVSEIMRPGVITIGEHASLLQAKRSMVRHGVHSVLVLGRESGLPLGWVSADGLLFWLERDLTALSASQAVTEPPHFIEPDATARAALEMLQKPAVSRLLVRSAEGGAPHGVVAPLDLVELVTRPS